MTEVVEQPECLAVDAKAANLRADVTRNAKTAGGILACLIDGLKDPTLHPGFESTLTELNGREGAVPMTAKSRLALIRDFTKLNLDHQKAAFDMMKVKGYSHDSLSAWMQRLMTEFRREFPDAADQQRIENVFRVVGDPMCDWGE